MLILLNVRFEFIQTLYNAVREAFFRTHTIFNNTGIPFVILGRIPSFSAYNEFLQRGGLSNIFPEASTLRFKANSFGIFEESDDGGCRRQIGHVTIEENGIEMVMGHSKLSLKIN